MRAGTLLLVNKLHKFKLKNTQLVGLVIVTVGPPARTFRKGKQEF